MNIYLRLLLLFSLGGIYTYAQSNASGDKKIACECAMENTSRTSILKGETLSLHLSVSGMSCEGCSAGLTQKLSALKGVYVDKVSHKTSSVALQYKNGESDLSEITSGILNSGFKVNGEIHTVQIENLQSDEEQTVFLSAVKEMEGVLSAEKLVEHPQSFQIITGVMTCSSTIFKKLEQAGYQVSSSDLDLASSAR